jgi:hypothetical protein
MSPSHPDALLHDQNGVFPEVHFLYTQVVGLSGLPYNAGGPQSLGSGSAEQPGQALAFSGWASVSPA